MFFAMEFDSVMDVVMIDLCAYIRTVCYEQCTLPLSM